MGTRISQLGLRLWTFILPWPAVLTTQHLEILRYGLNCNAWDYARGIIRLECEMEP